MISKITESQNSGRSSDLVTVTGSAFGNSLSVAIYFGGTQVATSTTNSTGYFSASYLVPRIAHGDYTVEAVDSEGNNASTVFSVH